MDYYDPAEHAPMVVIADLCGPEIPAAVLRQRNMAPSASYRGKYHDLPTSVTDALRGFTGSLRDVA